MEDFIKNSRVRKLVARNRGSRFTLSTFLRRSQREVDLLGRRQCAEEKGIDVDRPTRTERRRTTETPPSLETAGGQRMTNNQ